MSAVKDTDQYRAADAPHDAPTKDDERPPSYASVAEPWPQLHAYPPPKPAFEKPADTEQTQSLHTLLKGSFTPTALILSCCAFFGLAVGLSPKVPLVEAYDAEEGTISSVMTIWSHESSSDSVWHPSPAQHGVLAGLHLSAVVASAICGSLLCWQMLNPLALRRRSRAHRLVNPSILVAYISTALLIVGSCICDWLAADKYIESATAGADEYNTYDTGRLPDLLICCFILSMISMAFWLSQRRRDRLSARAAIEQDARGADVIPLSAINSSTRMMHPPPPVREQWGQAL